MTSFFVYGNQHQYGPTTNRATPSEGEARPGVRNYDPMALPDITHTKLVKAMFGGEELPNPKWNELMRRAHEIAFESCGRSYEKLRLLTTANIVKGEKTDDGYKPLGRSFSLQAVAANDALRIVLGIARKLSLPVEVIFDWRVKEGAAHPGETGRVAWEP
jgi:hypothetical protein